MNNAAPPRVVVEASPESWASVCYLRCLLTTAESQLQQAFAVLHDIKAQRKTSNTELSICVKTKQKQKGQLVFLVKKIYTAVQSGQIILHNGTRSAHLVF